MSLKVRPIKGLIRKRDQIDSTLKLQGFRSRSNPPVYDIRIQDSASGHCYRLRIPTQSHQLSPHESSASFLRLGEPTLNRNSSYPRYFTMEQKIPESILEAANHKLAEIASYLLPHSK
ncbi:hypothetical protein GXN76_10325 [Kroppenstedtia pulmonis]|uniref:Uncharacterized protein n=1 Tax=Kroppenstedtia pulmonis TaxID=1380685 RepID=A0A7D4B2X8_9BACL|nr:hypothetical protein [Kroppenstedtia pulmonis]QKG84826.1 hypothetical protein GXN76_10325 [Kroppenstedtia pulmonis]